jgi:hypothetical protein
LVLALDGRRKRVLSSISHSFINAQGLTAQMLRFAWKRFTLIGEIMGEVNGRVLVTAFYYTILVPFGIISRIATDPLNRKSTPGWIERQPVKRDLDSARSQG